MQIRTLIGRSDESEVCKKWKTVIYKIIKMTVMSQKDLILNPKNWSRIATLWQRLQQSFRLMVGVPDYQNYLEHMKKHHPDLEAMDAENLLSLLCGFALSISRW